MSLYVLTVIPPLATFKIAIDVRYNLPLALAPFFQEREHWISVRHTLFYFDLIILHPAADEGFFIIRRDSGKNLISAKVHDDFREACVIVLIRLAENVLRKISVRVIILYHRLKHIPVEDRIAGINPSHPRFRILAHQ